MSLSVPRRALRKLVLVPILAFALLVVLVDAPAEPPSWSGSAQQSGSTWDGSNAGGRWAGTGDGRKIR